MSTTDVDVVIPVRNGAPFIAACLDSVIAQTHAPRSVVVVDDGSTDETAQILSTYGDRWPRLKVINSAARGVSAARNLALEYCRSPLVAFLDSDDVWHPTKLERQMALFRTRGAQVGFVHCSYCLIDEKGVRLDGSIIEPHCRGNVFRNLLVEGNVVSGSGSAVMARRSLLEKVGGFDERFTYGEDWDLWLRLAEISELDFVPDPLVAIRVHDRSAQRTAIARREQLNFLQQLLILDKWHGKEKFPRDLLRNYRRSAVHLAIARTGSRPPSLQERWRFYNELKHGQSRFGESLFSGPLGFFARQLSPGNLLRSLLRHLLTPAQYENLKSLVHAFHKR